MTRDVVPAHAGTHNHRVLSGWMHSDCVTTREAGADGCRRSPGHRLGGAMPSRSIVDQSMVPVVGMPSPVANGRTYCSRLTSIFTGSSHGSMCAERSNHTPRL